MDGFMNSRVHEMSDRMNQRMNECTSNGLNEWNYELKERSETNEGNALKRIDWIERKEWTGLKWMNEWMKWHEWMSEMNE